MFLLYLDESGDTGLYDPASPEKSGSQHFVLGGFVVHAKHWHEVLSVLKSFRTRLAKEGTLSWDTEFHCSELVSHKTKEYSHLSKKDAWKAIEEFAEALKTLKEKVHILGFAVDKSQFSDRTDYLVWGLESVLDSFTSLLHTSRTQGILIFDRASEKVTTKTVRSILEKQAKMRNLVEDPFFRISSDSQFVQAADVVSYTLREYLFPLHDRKKFNAHMIFKRHLEPLSQSPTGLSLLSLKK